MSHFHETPHFDRASALAASLSLTSDSVPCSHCHDMTSANDDQGHAEDDIYALEPSRDS